jgi:salicylate hydroxylase
MRVVIVGGGIGGLTAALALQYQGIESVVLEKASTLSEVGAGIQVAANGTLVLRELGVEAALAAVATVPERYNYRDIVTNELLYTAPLGQATASRYGALMYNVHRADLIGLLADALPPGTLSLGTECVAVAQHENGATVTLSSGAQVHGDAVVGADGIHSAVRDLTFGAEDKRFADILMWRALVPADRVAGLELPVAGNNWFGVGRNVISYWVRKDLYSVLASVPAGEVHRESWTDSGDIAELLESFAGSNSTVSALLGAIESSFITGMYFRDPLDRWTSGRVTLLGDAAHAMVPYLAQGACQSMEDAWTLAACLAKHGPAGVGIALGEYEQRRRPRTTRIQAGARFAVKMSHEPDEQSIAWRNGRWKGLQRIDPLARTSWEFAWGHNELLATARPEGEVLGLSSSREGKRMARPESQRAFDLWKGAITGEDIARGHLGQRAAYERFLTGSFPVPESLDLTDVELGGVPAIRVRGSAYSAATERAVLHFHGGAYVFGSARGSAEYAGRLADALDAECFTVDYRLAPEHPYPAAIDDSFAAYRGLLARGYDPSTILFSGESAGGGLALALGLALQRAGLAPPAGILAVCPFTDLTLSGPSIEANSGDDPASHRDSLAQLGASYFQGHEPTDPMVSPYFGDLGCLPPIFLTAAEGEVLESDTTRFASKARDAGVDVTLEMVADSVHIFTIFPFLPEARGVLGKACRWADRLQGVGGRAFEIPASH